jgi:hypothetical protein
MERDRGLSSGLHSLSADAPVAERINESSSALLSKLGVAEAAPAVQRSILVQRLRPCVLRL